MNAVQWLVAGKKDPSQKNWRIVAFELNSLNATVDGSETRRSPPDVWTPIKNVILSMSTG